MDIVLAIRRHFLAHGKSMFSNLPGEVLRDAGECADLESLVHVNRVFDSFIE
ncbi:hypothetical protein AAVH_23459, partial [Aphelenchoides avenae]